MGNAVGSRLCFWDGKGACVVDADCVRGSVVETDGVAESVRRTRSRASAGMRRQPLNGSIM